MRRKQKVYKVAFERVQKFDVYVRASGPTEAAARAREAAGSSIYRHNLHYGVYEDDYMPDATGRQVVLVKYVPKGYRMKEDWDTQD